MENYLEVLRVAPTTALPSIFPSILPRMSPIEQLGAATFIHTHDPYLLSVSQHVRNRDNTSQYFTAGDSVNIEFAGDTALTADLVVSEGLGFLKQKGLSNIPLTPELRVAIAPSVFHENQQEISLRDDVYYSSYPAAISLVLAKAPSLLEYLVYPDPATQAQHQQEFQYLQLRLQQLLKLYFLEHYR